MVAHLESERDSRIRVNDLLQAVLKRLEKNGNGKISIREIAAWSTAIVTGLAAFVQYLK